MTRKDDLAEEYVKLADRRRARDIATALLDAGHEATDPTELLATTICAFGIAVGALFAVSTEFEDFPALLDLMVAEAHKEYRRPHPGHADPEFKLTVQ